MEIDKETLAALIQQGVEKALDERTQQGTIQTTESKLYRVDWFFLRLMLGGIALTLSGISLGGMPTNSAGVNWVLPLIVFFGGILLLATCLDDFARLCK